MKRATLKDISRLTGFSISAVSRALKDHPDISQATKNKVKEVARALNYLPNLSARTLRTNASKIIALILPELTDFFFPRLLKGITEIVEARGYTLVFLQSNNNFEREKELVDFCINVAAEGVLISLSVETEALDHCLILKDAGIPLIQIDRIIKDDDFPSITIDDRETAFNATEYLIQQNHKKILGIFGDQRLVMTQLRAEGFKLAHAHHLHPIAESQLLKIPDRDDIASNISSFIQEHPDTTAIFTMSDTLLVHTHHAICQLGFRIPEDMSLISISDGVAPNYLYPKITHMHHSGLEVGTRATRLLFNIIDGMTPAFNFYEIEAALVKGGST